MAHGGCPRLLLLLREPAQAFCEDLTPPMFLLRVYFSCFILGKKTFLTLTRPFRETFGKMHIQF